MEITEAQKGVLELLKRKGPATASQLAETLETTAVSARQHLTALEERGLAEAQESRAQRRGRPSLLWSVTAKSQPHFPDHHGELTVGLIAAVRRALGEESLDRILQERARAQVSDYRNRMPNRKASLRERVEALAAIRSEEGYLAEARTEAPGSLLLLEHHCPICEAATHCVGLCRTELETFQSALGDDVTVERLEHLLSGDQRCVYRVRRRSASSDPSAAPLHRPEDPSTRPAQH